MHGDTIRLMPKSLHTRIERQEVSPSIRQTATMYRRQYYRHSILSETSQLWDEENLSTQIDEFYEQPSAAGAPLPSHECDYAIYLYQYLHGKKI